MNNLNSQAKVYLFFYTNTLQIRDYNTKTMRMYIHRNTQTSYLSQAQANRGLIYNPGPGCSKHHYVNKVVVEDLLKKCYKINKINCCILCCWKLMRSLQFLAKKTVSKLKIHLNFKFSLTNDVVSFWITGPWLCYQVMETKH